MHSDVETTIYQLHKLLTSKDSSTCISLRQFIRYLKINYLATYATILNNENTKTEHDMKVNKNKAKRYKNNHNNSTQV